MNFRNSCLTGTFFSPDEPPSAGAGPEGPEITEPAVPLTRSDESRSGLSPTGEADFESIINDRVAREVDRRLTAMQPATHPRQAHQSPIERARREAEQQGIFEPEWAINRAIQIQGEDTERRVLGVIAPHLQRLTQRETVNELAGGMGSAAREYLQRLAPGIDPTTLTPDVKDLLVRAARDYEREKTPARVTITPEPVTSEQATGITAEERLYAAELKRDHGIELTDADIMASRTLPGIPAALGGAR